MKQTKSYFSNIAELIKSAREAQGLKQSDLALALGYSTAQFISNTERGLCSLPPEKWKRLAKCLKIKPEEILEAHLIDERAILLHKSGLDRLHK